MRIRCHGDYHLGQVLYTGKDFVVIDFEGEPARPISERRIKRPALQDVAGMLRSFHYASQTVYLEATRSAVLHEEDTEKALQSLRFWYEWVSAAFLRSYLDVAREAAFLPKTKEELRVLLEAHLLEKALYEVRYELNNRPNWICVPLRGIHELLSAEEAS
jgi:maltose alpha-D-glucosyltransferase/alpha-amylase